MKPQIVSFKCILKSRTGQWISSTINRDVLTTDQVDGTLLRGLSLAMQDLTAGEKRLISLTAQEAYGYYDPNKVILYPRNKLPRDIQKGQMVQIVSKTKVVRSYKIIDFHGDMAQLDQNHPLAGQDLVFEIEVISVRNASKAEILDSMNQMSNQNLH